MATEPLEEYRRKRDFSTTPEPAGAPAPDTAAGERPLTFVVHKHAARALHYDLRLEVGGVYASWAVPKGPSLDTKDKHLAVHVEDHPLEYGAFEGVIPAGEYGGGTVMIWDRGTFAPVGDPAAGIAKGDFKFVLSGSKLQGQWVLVRMKPRPGEKRESWLLIKERDEHVRPHDEYDILAAEPDSAATGRTMEQIAAAGETYAAGAPADAVSAAASPGADQLPLDAPFQLATLVDQAPAGDGWVHEVKYDGYRLHIALENGAAKTLTRHGADWSDRFPTLVAAAEALPAKSLLLDGEAVVLDPEGRSDFGLLQEALSKGDHAAVRFEAFDLLFLDGHDLRDLTLLKRKELLTALLGHAPAGGPLLAVEHFPGHGPEYHAASCELLLEGSISKREDRPWIPGRSRDWLKVKCLARQEFVVGGWTDPAGSREGFGALLLGVNEPDGGLRYAGRVGTGFTQRTLAEVSARLTALASDASPFADAPDAAGVHWARPELVVDVAFREWTRDGLVRQGSFKGMREDKPAAEVVRESAAAPAGDPAATPPDPPAAVADPPDSAHTAKPEPAIFRGVTITHPDRVLQPGGISKADLARYYDSVAEWMLPHLQGRPLTIVRCPGEGGAGGCFYQKHPDAKGWPKMLGRVTVQDSDGPADYAHVLDAAGLLALVQLATLEIHTWGSSVADPELPDRIIIDLDPGEGVAFSEVTAMAGLFRDALRTLGLEPFAKTTGGHGLHVVTPIVPARGWDEVRAFAHALVRTVSVASGGAVTDRMAKSERGGRVFADYLRNAHGATAVCAYSTRARPGAPVSVPVTWQELAAGLDPAAFDTHTVPARLASLEADPWAGYGSAARPLTDAAIAAVGAQPSLL